MKKLLSLVIVLSILVCSIFSLDADTTVFNYNQQKHISSFVEKVIKERLNLFINKNSDITLVYELYNKNLVKDTLKDKNLQEIALNGERHAKLQIEFGKRIRNAKNTIGRDYYKFDTNVIIDAIEPVSPNVYKVKAIEKTLLYFKGTDEPNAFEGYSEVHIFTIIFEKDKPVILDEEMPNSLIYNEYSNPIDLVINDKNTEEFTKQDTKLTTGEFPTAVTTLSVYDGVKAALYADKYWSSYNPDYRSFSPSDCTNYISQCIKEGFSGLMDQSGTHQWWYIWPGQYPGVGYTYSWGRAQDSHDYWIYRQINTASYSQQFTTPPSSLDVLPEGGVIWNYAKKGNPIYYHTDPTVTDVYYNHAGIITGKLGYLNDFGQLITYRPYVNCHTNDRYHVDYTLYPYLNYQAMIDSGYGPSIKIINIPDWSPVD